MNRIARNFQNLWSTIYPLVPITTCYSVMLPQPTHFSMLPLQLLVLLLLRVLVLMSVSKLLVLLLLRWLIPATAPATITSTASTSTTATTTASITKPYWWSMAWEFSQQLRPLKKMNNTWCDNDPKLVGNRNGNLQTSNYINLNQIQSAYIYLSYIYIYINKDLYNLYIFFYLCFLNRSPWSTKPGHHTDPVQRWPRSSSINLWLGKAMPRPCDL